jgi:hypothetical protein
VRANDVSQHVIAGMQPMGTAGNMQLPGLRRADRTEHARRGIAYSRQGLEQSKASDPDLQQKVAYW